MTAPVRSRNFFSTERVVALIAILVAGLFGFLIGDDSASVRQLHEEIDELQLKLDQSKQDKQRQTLTRSSAARRLSRAPAFSPRSPDLEKPTVQSEERRSQEGNKIPQRLYEEHIARTAAERANDYAAVLSDLGLEPGAVSQVQSNLTELHRKAIAAGDPAQVDQIIGLMKEAGATTTETWHGPYDPLPRPATGDQAIERMRADYTSLIDNANALLDAAGQSAMPETFELLYGYYADKVQEKYDELLFWDRPVEVIDAEMKTRVEERFRKMRERHSAGQQ